MLLFIKNPTLKKVLTSLLSFSVVLSIPLSAMFPHRTLADTPIYAANQDCEPPNYVLPDHTLISRIVVKFHEGSGIQLDDLGRWKNIEPDEVERSSYSARSFEIDLLTKELTDLKQLMIEQNYQKQPLFKVKRETIATHLKLLHEKQTNQKLEDLRLYYELIPKKKKVTYQDMADILAILNRLQLVEIAYAEPVYIPKKLGISKTDLTATDEPTDTVALNPYFTPTPNFENLQTYLDSPPFGIGARDCAWSEPGGRGSHVKIVDVEGGWNTNHEDLPPLFYTYGTPVTTPFFQGHGTAVLGVIAAMDNNFGVTGIVSNAQIGYASVCDPNANNCWGHEEKQTFLNIANAIYEAANAVGKGGIILIELHWPGPQNSKNSCPCSYQFSGYIPVEYWQAVFDVISYATANGVIVVEAGGDGCSNLDDPVYHGCFNPKVRDSGAILVAASYPAPGMPSYFSNWGSRMNVHAWGNNVTTLGFFGDLFKGGINNNENRYYTAVFSGTSSAVPIVAGAVGSAQGVAVARWKTRLEPLLLRKLLVETGTPQQPSKKKIGPLPNLCRLIPTVKMGLFDTEN